MTIKVKITRNENAEFFGLAVDDTVEVDFEAYVSAVVASEIGNAHIEACKAQAIAARTFAVRYILDDQAISDSSSVAQAYRAKRNNARVYPNALEATQLTRGQVLTYGGVIISPAAYSANNGGRTTSCESRWGRKRPYLIEQDDPWDAMAGSGKTGHGVGMSQRGAKYAAGIGKEYTDILSFYYPGAELCDNYGVKKVIQASDLIALFQKALTEKWGYIWGGAGQLWTKEKQQNATRDMTVKYGTKWIGRNVADCSGMFTWAFKKLGGYMYHGSNTMWNKYCECKGELKDGERTDGCILKPGTAVFLKKTTNGVINRHHVGLFIGGRVVIEAKGTQYGVVTSDISHWHEWGELKGVLFESGGDIALSTLAKGSKGSLVLKLQTLLMAAGYSLPKYGADADFGNETQSAVKALQAAHGIEQTGIADERVWGVLEPNSANGTSEQEPKNGAESDGAMQDLASQEMVALELDKATMLVFYAAIKKALDIA